MILNTLRSTLLPITSRKFSSTMSNTSGYVKRTTLFKIPQEHIDTVLKEYVTLRKNAVKVCFPSQTNTFASTSLDRSSDNIPLKRMASPTLSPT